MIREYKAEDIDICVQLLIEAYNCEPWNNHWTEITAERYLNEFVANDRFVGFVLCENEEIIGAIFARKKTWWTNNELYVEEIFIKPEMHGKGHGKLLLSHAEDYARSQGLAGVTLLTNKYFPARSFYDKNGYTCAEHVIFMYKEF